MTYKHTSEINEENGKRSDKVKENSLIDLREIPVFRKACSSNNLGCKDGCVGIPAAVKLYGSRRSITRPDLTSRQRRPPMQDLRLRKLAQTP